MNVYTTPNLRSSIGSILSAIAILISLVLFSMPTFFTSAMAGFDLETPSREPTAPGIINGTVTNEDGEAIPGVTVIAYRYWNDVWVWEKSAVTEADGQYSLQPIQVGIYRIGVRDNSGLYIDAFYGNVADIQDAIDISIAGNVHDEIDLTMPLGGAVAGTISLSALGPEYTLNDLGLAVYAQRSEVVEKITGWELNQSANGDYTILGIPSGEHIICASIQYGEYPALRDLRECHQASVGDIGDATPVAIVAGETVPNIDFALGQGSLYGTISGQVTDDSGNALSGAAIIIQSVAEIGETLQHDLCDRFERDRALWSIPNQGSITLCTTTDSAGQYTIPYVIPGAYTLRVQDSDNAYKPTYYGNSDALDEAQIIDVAPDTNLENIDVAVLPGGTIIGQVLVQDVSPPNSAYMSAYRQFEEGFLVAGSMQVDPFTGEYEISGLASGTYSMSISLGYGSTSGDLVGGDPIVVEITESETVSNVNFSLAEGQYNGVIQGKVTNEGTPLPGIRVELLTLNDAYPEPIFYTETDTDGNYKIEGLGDNRNRLHFLDTVGTYFSRFYNQTQILTEAETVSVDHNESRTIDVELGLASGIRGTVQDTSATGRSIGIWVRQQNSNEQLLTIAHASASSFGFFEIKDLAAGDYILDFYDSSGNASGTSNIISLLRISVSVEAGQVTRGVTAVLGAGVPTALEAIDEPSLAPADEDSGLAQQNSHAIYIPFSTQ